MEIGFVIQFNYLTGKHFSSTFYIELLHVFTGYSDR